MKEIPEQASKIIRSLCRNAVEIECMANTVHNCKETILMKIQSKSALLKFLQFNYLWE
jgi:hypothetical protein